MRSLIVIGCFLVLGCSYQPNNVQIEIDSTFSADKQTLIYEALGKWTTATHGVFQAKTFQVVENLDCSNADYNVIRFCNADVNDWKDNTPGYYILGDTSSTGHTILDPETHIQAIVYLQNSEDDDTFLFAATHEIGHTVNVNHYCTPQLAQSKYNYCEYVDVKGQPSIMYPAENEAEIAGNIDSSVEFMDVYRFCAVWGCKPQ